MTRREPLNSAGWKLACVALARLGIAAPSYHAEAVLRRVPACLRMLRVQTAEEALRRLEREPCLADALANVVLLGVTEFFRDASVFEALANQVLPNLARRNERKRIWSAACSGGQELYSVAMMLADGGWRHDDCELWGTDCRRAAVERACAGVYAIDEIARLAPLWRSYFAIEGATAAIDPVVRAGVRWKTADLTAAVEGGPWHLILWRNMAIYLNASTAEEIWARLCNELAPEGFLVAGKAENPPRWLPLRRLARCVFQKSGEQ